MHGRRDAGLGMGAQEQEMINIIVGIVITWSMSTRMMLDKSCRLCRQQWGMHHRCPALDGRWNCC